MASSVSFLRLTKRFARARIVDPLQSWIAKRRLAQFVASFRQGAAPAAEAIGRLRQAWGNEGFSADPDYILHVIRLAQRHSGPILEFGTGLTTLLAALICERRDEKVWSLEQDEYWAEFVKERLSAHAIENVTIIHAPLKDYGGFVWYDLEGVALPASFGLAICDGPAVFQQWGAAYLQWRYGLIPMVSSRKISIETILLDDADEPRAANVLQRWATEFDLEQTIFQSALGSCVQLRLGHMSPTGHAEGRLRSR
jgi:hypothetical protein